MNGKHIWLCLFLCLWSSLAQGVVTANLDKTEGTTDELFQLTLSIEGSLTDTPKFPKIPGLEVVQNHQSTSMSIINGRTSRELKLVFVLKASKPGTYDIPPIKVFVNDKLEETLPLQIKVQELTLEARKQKPIYVLQSLSKSKFYQGETVVLDVAVYSRYQMPQQPRFAPRLAPGMRVEPIGDMETAIQSINGQQYKVVRQRYALVVDEANMNVVPATTVIAFLATGRQSFFSSGVQNQELQSNEIDIDVKPLPTKGRSAKFSGLVGEYKLNLEEPKRQVNVGENLALTLVLEGNGESKTMAPPLLSIEGNNAFKVYRDKAEDQLSLGPNGRLKSRKLFNIALVPRQAGAYDLGEVTIEYFNSKDGQYKILSASLGEIQVNGVAASGAAQSQSQSMAMPDRAIKKPVKVMNEDILGLHSSEALKSHDDLSLGRLIGGIVLALLCLAIGPGLSLYQVWRDPDETRLLKRRRSVAYREFQKRIAAWDESQGANAAGKMQDNFKAYLGDKFALSALTLTEKDIDEQLRKVGLDPGLQQSILKFYRSLDRLRYADSKNSIEIASLKSEALSLVGELEAQC